MYVLPGYAPATAAEALGRIGAPEAVVALKAARAQAAKSDKSERKHLAWVIGRVLGRIGKE